MSVVAGLFIYKRAKAKQWRLLLRTLDNNNNKRARTSLLFSIRPRSHSRSAAVCRDFVLRLLVSLENTAPATRQSCDLFAPQKSRQLCRRNAKIQASSFFSTPIHFKLAYDRKSTKDEQQWLWDPIFCPLQQEQCTNYVANRGQRQKEEKKKAKKNGWLYTIDCSFRFREKGNE